MNAAFDGCNFNHDECACVAPNVQPYVFYTGGAGNQFADMVTKAASTAGAIAVMKRVGVLGFRAVELITKLLEGDTENIRYKALLVELCRSAAKPSNCPTAL